MLGRAPRSKLRRLAGCRVRFARRSPLRSPACSRAQEQRETGAKVGSRDDPDVCRESSADADGPSPVPDARLDKARSSRSRNEEEVGRLPQAYQTKTSDQPAYSWDDFAGGRGRTRWSRGNKLCRPLDGATSGTSGELQALRGALADRGNPSSGGLNWTMMPEGAGRSPCACCRKGAQIDVRTSSALRWTGENQTLVSTVERDYGRIHRPSISTSLPEEFGRIDGSCSAENPLGRRTLGSPRQMYKTLRPGRPKFHRPVWTEDRNQTLIAAVEQQLEAVGRIRWASTAAGFPGQTASLMQQHRKLRLGPPTSPRLVWTEDKNQKLITAVEQQLEAVGRIRWASIAAGFPGQSLGSLRHQYKKLRSGPPTSRRLLWNEERNQTLIAAVEQQLEAVGKIKWSNIAAAFPGRTSASLMQQYRKLRLGPPTSLRPVWTEDKNQKLVTAVEKQVEVVGRKRWAGIAARFPGQTPTSQQQQYRKLRPDLPKSPRLLWTEERNQSLITAVEQHLEAVGRIQWANIAACFPGRTSASLRQQYRKLGPGLPTSPRVMWTEDMDQKLIRAVEQQLEESGRIDWSKVAAIFPRNTVASVHLKYYQLRRGTREFRRHRGARDREEMSNAVLLSQNGEPLRKLSDAAETSKSFWPLSLYKRLLASAQIPPWLCRYRCNSKLRAEGEAKTCQLSRIRVPTDRDEIGDGLGKTPKACAAKVSDTGGVVVRRFQILNRPWASDEISIEESSAADKCGPPNWTKRIRSFVDRSRGAVMSKLYSLSTAAGAREKKRE